MRNGEEPHQYSSLTDNAGDERAAPVGVGGHLRVLFAALAPAAHGHRGDQARVALLQSRELAERAVLAHLALRRNGRNGGGGGVSGAPGGWRSL